MQVKIAARIAGMNKMKTIYFLTKNIVQREISKKSSLGHFMLHTFLMINTSKNVWCPKIKEKTILCQRI